MKINNAKESNETHKNKVKEEILQVIKENFIATILDMFTKMYRRHPRNSKTTKVENLKKHKKN
jgi:hypothetical protein